MPGLHPHIAVEKSPTAMPPRPQDDVDPWGTYHYRPGCKRYRCNGCKRTCNDLTAPRLPQRPRPLAYWVLATLLLCPACSSRRIAWEVGGHSARAIAGAGGYATRPCPIRCSTHWKARSKRMSCIRPPATKDKRKAVVISRWVPRTWPSQEARARPGAL
jgi:hypothetical protein